MYSSYDFKQIFSCLGICLVILIHIHAGIFDTCDTMRRSSKSHSMPLRLSKSAPGTAPWTKLLTYGINAVHMLPFTIKRFSQQHKVVLQSSYLISLFRKNDSCAFFPSRLDIYRQDLVSDTRCVSILIHNLLHKDNICISISVSSSVHLKPHESHWWM